MYSFYIENNILQTNLSTIINLINTNKLNMIPWILVFKFAFISFRANTWRGHQRGNSKTEEDSRWRATDHHPPQHNSTGGNNNQWSAIDDRWCDCVVVDYCAGYLFQISISLRKPEINYSISPTYYLHAIYIIY